MRTVLFLLMVPILPLAAQTPSKPRLELGFEERIRMEDWDNIQDHRDALADYRTHYRFRTRAWATWRPTSGLEFQAGLVNEVRKITRPDIAQNYREVLVETLSLDWRPTADFGLKVGRQGLSRGEGFILQDGTPADGSRTGFYDALVAGWKRGDHLLEAIVIRNQRQDWHIGALNESDLPGERPKLGEADEAATGLYYTGQWRKTTRVEAYALQLGRTGDPRFPAKGQPDRHFLLAGGRWAEELGGGFSLATEAALERGTVEARPGQSSQDLKAWGGYARLRRTFAGAWKPSASVSLTGLSGDDPRTGRVEGWDPAFGRFPKWSDLYVYSLVPEAEVALWSNLRMTEVEGRIQPRTWLALRAAWYHLQAFQAQPQKGASFGPGTGRGDLGLLRADLTLAPAWKGHLLYEHLKPGSFYAGRDGGHFLRAEVSWTFTRGF